MKSKELKTILQSIESLSISEINFLIDELPTVLANKIFDKYWMVDIVNTNGNIAETITKETGYECYWKGSAGYIGKNYIKIPKSEIAKPNLVMLEAELKSKYENI